MSSPVSTRASRTRLAVPPLTDRAYLAIKEEILSNRLEPGAVLPIQRFTEEMKLSRTPVREAILRLQREGFVEVRPRLGTIVAHLDLRRLRAMYHVRSVLEGDAARLACEIIPEQVLSTCDKELRRQRTSGTLDVAAMSEAAQHLHEAIIAHCGKHGSDGNDSRCAGSLRPFPACVKPEKCLYFRCLSLRVHSRVKPQNPFATSPAATSHNTIEILTLRKIG